MQINITAYMYKFETNRVTFYINWYLGVSCCALTYSVYMCICISTCAYVNTQTQAHIYKDTFKFVLYRTNILVHICIEK